MIDITTLGEAFDPMAVGPIPNTTLPKSRKYLWITIIVIIALFAFCGIWLVGTNKSVKIIFHNSY
ncbi:MAG: hypothetical protein IPI65_16060 [Bacteroidetes bacterium]|nr:hypothetical protein [Bacteroidota bacterium]